MTSDLSVPPPDSPPPLPPNFPGGGTISLDALKSPYAIGPTAIAIPDRYPKTSSPLSSSYSDQQNSQDTPGVRVETATPDDPAEAGSSSLDYDGSRTWRIDSFDDDDVV